jgi:hypothetical protein
MTAGAASETSDARDDNPLLVALLRDCWWFALFGV